MKKNYLSVNNNNRSNKGGFLPCSTLFRDRKNRAFQGSAQKRFIQKISSLKSADFPNALGALPIPAAGFYIPLPVLFSKV